MTKPQYTPTIRQGAPVHEAEFNRYRTNEAERSDQASQSSWLGARQHTPSHRYTPPEASPASASWHDAEAAWRHSPEEWSMPYAGYGSSGYGFTLRPPSAYDHPSGQRHYPVPPQQTRGTGVGNDWSAVAAADQRYYGDQPNRVVEDPGLNFQRGRAREGAYGAASYAYGDYEAEAGRLHEQDWQKRHLSRPGKTIPRGYKRSDERLREVICEQLIDSELDVSDVEVEVQNGYVTLNGTVPARWTKHAIEDLIEQCIGVEDIDNRLRLGSTAVSMRSVDLDTSSQRDLIASTVRSEEPKPETE